MNKEKLNDIVCESSSDYAVLNDAYNYIEDLEQQVKKQKEVIDKAIEYIEGHKYTMKHYEPYGTPTGLPNYETYNIKGYYQLLDILKDKEV